MEALLYNTQYADKTPRTVPMRVLCMGLSRSGTDSLRSALIILGIRNPAHGFTLSAEPGSWQKLAWLGRKKLSSGSPRTRVTRQDFDVVMGDCEAVTDFTAAFHAADLYEAYPEAKVILNVRQDLGSWYKSVDATFGQHRKSISFSLLAFFSGELYWRRRFFIECWDVFWHNDIASTAIWRYKEHSDMIRGMVPKENLLEWSVEDGWEPLCAFLELEVPKEPFPNGNMPRGFFEKVRVMREKDIRAAWRNLAICLVVAGAVGLQSFRYWRRR